MAVVHARLIAGPLGADRVRVAADRSWEWWRRVARWTAQTICGLGGHEMLKYSTRARITLRCVTCGFESPGWNLDAAPPNVTFGGDPERFALGTVQRPHMATRPVLDGVGPSHSS
jgi:hypothetical protein